MSEVLECDVLVVGSGPGGATTAALCAEAGRDVLLVEEGKNYRLDSARPFTMAEMDQKYRNGGLNSAMGATNITYLEGRCVGGGSEINAALYHRPLPETMREWQVKYRIADFDRDGLDRWFEATERELNVSTYPDGTGPVSEHLRASAKKLGWKASEIARFWKYDKGPDGKWVGRRQSMSETLVPRAIQAGARLSPETRIERLVLRGDSAREAIARRSDGTKVRIKFRQVFVCAGAVQTPALLRRSGITTNVGNSLRLHPMVRVVARFPEPMNDPTWGVPVCQVEEFKPHLTLGCSHSSVPHLSLWLGDGVDDKAKRLEQWDRHAIFYVAAMGTGKGSVRNLPVVGEPFVRFGMTSQDQSMLCEGLYQLGRLLFAGGAEEVYNPVPGAPPIKRESDLAFLRRGVPQGRMNVSTIHLFSSCPMGEDTDTCAVDSHGRVHGLANVWVNDASILPHSPGVNPQGTILAVARRNVTRFLEGAGRTG